MSKKINASANKKRNRVQEEYDLVCKGKRNTLLIIAVCVVLLIACYFGMQLLMKHFGIFSTIIIIIIGVMVAFYLFKAIKKYMEFRDRAKELQHQLQYMD